MQPTVRSELQAHHQFRWDVILRITLEVIRGLRGHHTSQAELIDPSASTNHSEGEKRDDEHGCKPAPNQYSAER